jgi:long-chain acyl-CoA synthetase
MELGRHPLVEQAVVIANNRKFASALIFLNAENAKRLLRRSEVDFRLGKALESKRVHEAIRRHINRVNSKLNYWERIKQWTLVGDNLSVKSGLLTPTLKIRRKAVETRYADLIERMYEEHD